MTMSATEAAQVQSPARVPLGLWVGIGVYMLLLVTGNHLLNDPDTYWQITVGQWIIDHRMVPTTDVYSFTMRGQPWISTQWLAQVTYATAYDVMGWAGPVILAASAAAATFALLARQLRRHLTVTATLAFVIAAIALTVGHLLARPHVLAMPVMVLWVGGLIAAMDRRAAPSFWLLPLMALWANLHGGFVLGLALIAPIALEVIWNSDARLQKSMLLRWGLFAVAAVAASCITPYGWESLLASRRILGLGAALDLIGEWRPANFAHPGVSELAVLLAVALVLWRGVVLPPMRMALVIGLIFMALSHARNVEVFALLAPLVVAFPLGRQFGHGRSENASAEAARSSGISVLGVVVCVVAATAAVASTRRFEPNLRSSPVAAVTELKTHHFSRVFNDYDFGGYLIANNVAPFIDGRTELYGEKFFVDHNDASGLMHPENLFRLLDDYDIEATLMRTQSAATKLLDHMDGWQKIYSDDVATIHVRKTDARHTVEPAVSPSAR